MFLVAVVGLEHVVAVGAGVGLPRLPRLLLLPLRLDLVLHGEVLVDDSVELDGSVACGSVELTGAEI